MATDPSALMAWAYPWRAWLDAAIGREIARTRARYELTLDEFRGVYVSDEQVDRLLASGEQVPRSESPRPAVVPGTPLATIAGAFGLGDAAVAALFSAMALEFDAKYEALYAYLNDDATRRYATVELCRRAYRRSACGAGTGRAASRRGLVGGDAGACRRAVASGRADTGGPGPHVRVSARRSRRPRMHPRSARRTSKRVADVLATGRVTNCVIDGARRDERQAMAHTIAGHGGRALIEVLDPADERLRETLIAARLHDAMVSVDLEELAPASVRIAATAPVPVLFAARSGELWRAVVEGFDYEVVHLRPPPAPSRARCWRGPRRSRHRGGAIRHCRDRRAVRTVAHADRAGGRARGSSGNERPHRSQGRSPDRRGAECTTALEELATGSNLCTAGTTSCCPSRRVRRLHELAGRDTWRGAGVRRLGVRARAGGTASLRALFAGASGTGKTMAAAVVAASSASTCTRSTCRRSSASTSARPRRTSSGSSTRREGRQRDAVLRRGRRAVRQALRGARTRTTATPTSRSRTCCSAWRPTTACVILATNLASATSTRRSCGASTCAVDFPLARRSAAASGCGELRSRRAAPIAADVDFAFLARQFTLTGGDIRNVALGAAFLAAHEDRDIEMAHLVRAVARQRRKQGKLPTASEFKHFLAAVHGEGA